MINLIKWTDRTFEFNIPEELFPAIVSRLAGTPARLEEIAKSISTGQLIKKIGESWSVQENIGHLSDVEELHMLRLKEYIDKKDELSAADLTNHKTNTANHNSKKIDEILCTFRKMRNEYVNTLDCLDGEAISRYSYHPRLKLPMRLIDNAYFAAEHDDHHIAIIRNIISQF
jgi:hypothetical protein